jgi:hypothetical protein
MSVTKTCPSALSPLRAAVGKVVDCISRETDELCDRFGYFERQLDRKALFRILAEAGRIGREMNRLNIRILDLADD